MVRVRQEALHNIHWMDEFEEQDVRNMLPCTKKSSKINAMSNKDESIPSYAPQEMYAVRFLIFLESGPQTGTFHQVRLTRDQMSYVGAALRSQMRVDQNGSVVASVNMANPQKFDAIKDYYDPSEL